LLCLIALFSTCFLKGQSTELFFEHLPAIYFTKIFHTFFFAKIPQTFGIAVGYCRIVDLSVAANPSHIQFFLIKKASFLVFL